MIAAAAAARLRLLAASRRKCESMATAPDRHASCARWIVGTTKPRMMGSAQAAIEPTAGQNASSAGSPWWRRFEAMWKRARPREWRSIRIRRPAMAIRTSAIWAAPS
jgi:hypothetical protein